MAEFPSMAWVDALVAAAQRDPAMLPVTREWGGRSIGVIIGRDAGLARDFCVFARPHPTEPRLVDLHPCEDEDDLELEEPDYLFRAPYGTVRAALQDRLDPLELLKKGQIRVAGDLGFLIPFGQRHRAVGERVVASVATRFA